MTMNEYVVKIEKQNKTPLAGFGEAFDYKFRKQAGTMPSMLVNIYHAGALADIYADAAGTSKDNPITVTGTMFSFCAAPVEMSLELYSDIEIVRMTLKPGVNTVIVPNKYVTLPDELYQQQYDSVPQTLDGAMQYYQE
jgi:hypothetical protein